MKYSFVFSLLLLFTFGCRQTLPPSDINIPEGAGYNGQKSDMEKLTWLIGSWQTPDGLMQQEIQLLNDSTLSIHSIFRNENRDETVLMQWAGKQLRFGEDRIIAWIGRKSIRMESLKSEVASLTWTRRDNTSWYMIVHHADRPASQILLERVPKLGLINP